MQSIKVKHFSLKHTLDSGQFFRYIEKDGWFHCNYEENLFSVRQEKDILFYDNISREDLIGFFSLNEDYDLILSQLSRDSLLKSAINKYSGLRIIKQDPWECTIAFVCSSFSNIKRIKHNLNCIVQQFSSADNPHGLSFPKPGSLNSLKKLEKCSLGYRAKYVYELNKLVSQEFFDALEELSYEDAKSVLMELPGIGEKVADCICLFSLQKGESFPIDVWMERAMYPLVKSKNHKRIKEFALKRWGKFAGYAQQFLYHEIRLKE